MAAGDDDAFAALYDETASRVFGLALSILRDRAQAETVTEETYRQIRREAARFDAGRTGAIPWILTIAHGNATLRAQLPLSGTRRTGRRLSASTRGRVRACDTEAGELSYEDGRVRRALGRLTPVQRESLELAYLGGHTRSEVADLTRTSDELASSAIRDGLLRLRDLLNGDE